MDYAHPAPTMDAAVPGLVFPVALPRVAVTDGRTKEDAAFVWMKQVAVWRELGFELNARGHLDVIAD